MRRLYIENSKFFFLVLEQKFIKVYLYSVLNGNPLLYSCLENPVDGGAWWAALHRVAQSHTRLKQLSSSSSFYLWAIQSPDLPTYRIRELN